MDKQNFGTDWFNKVLEEIQGLYVTGGTLGIKKNLVDVFGEVHAMKKMVDKNIAITPMGGEREHFDILLTQTNERIEVKTSTRKSSKGKDYYRWTKPRSDCDFLIRVGFTSIVDTRDMFFLIYPKDEIPSLHDQVYVHQMSDKYDEAKEWEKLVSAKTTDS